MSASMLGGFTAAIVTGVVVAIFESYRVALSACQFFLRLLASSCPAGGLPTEARPSKDGAAVDHPEVATSYGPQGQLVRPSSPLSSLPRRRLSRPPIFQPPASGKSLHSIGAIAVLAAVDPSPDFGAFGAGVELGIFTALFTISSLLVANWIIKTMRSSK